MSFFSAPLSADTTTKTGLRTAGDALAATDGVFGRFARAAGHGVKTTPAETTPAKSAPTKTEPAKTTVSSKQEASRPVTTKAAAPLGRAPGAGLGRKTLLGG